MDLLILQDFNMKDGKVFDGQIEKAEINKSIKKERKQAFTSFRNSTIFRSNDIREGCIETGN